MKKVDGAEDRQQFSNLIVKHKQLIIKYVSTALEQYKTMRRNMRLHLTYAQQVEGIDYENTL